MTTYSEHMEQLANRLILTRCIGVEDNIIDSDVYGLDMQYATYQNDDYESTFSTVGGRHRKMFERDLLRTSYRLIHHITYKDYFTAWAKSERAIITMASYSKLLGTPIDLIDLYDILDHINGDALPERDEYLQAIGMLR